MWILLWTACLSGADKACMPANGLPADATASGCFVVSDQRLLLVRTSGGWSIPGGGIDDGESAAQAAQRETQEEAGVAVRARAPRCVVPSNRFVAFDCIPVGTVDPHPDRIETREARMMSLAEIDALPDSAWRFPGQHLAYRRALIEQKKP